ncbi:MAG: phenylalanyl-tRNA synthetase beta chain [Acidobacteriota bacterium]|jgi:phenylalanyl-tRNA synthetase beta chain|nr:phenylalanyl-tRNA synthetase beta chain [Acidobacteriota bacterium]
MDISYNWLRELTDVSVPPRELAERLTMAGLAVDSVREADDDHVLEFDLTSNRPDCLSHLGIAREVAALTGGSVRLPESKAKNSAGRTEEFTSVEIEDARLCPRYAARVVRGVKIGPSPVWLARRLQAIGQRPINNVADITNFVLHEMGQPLHAFDLAKLNEKKIVVRRARAGEKIKTLDGVERTLDERMLVIADAARAVAVAGVMGGAETEISDSTTDVLIESAYFDPQSVRRTSKVLGLQTEASYRFERGVDYEGVRRAQDRCVALICEIAGGTASEDAIDVYPRRIAPPTVYLRPRRVEELTGLSVTAEESLRILLSLGFNSIGRDASGGKGHASVGSHPDEVALSGVAGPASADTKLHFSVPTWRMDVDIEEDLVEEVARVVGYEKIGVSLPPSPVTGEYLAGDRRRRAARQMLTANGFNEAVNISFIDEAGAIVETGESRFELVPGLQKIEGEDAFVKLSNPVIEGARLMRPTLLPGLLEALRHNFNHGTRDVRLFETGRVFASAGGDEARPNEVEAFALVATGEALEEGRAAGRALDIFDLKGALEAATDVMRVGELEFESASVRHLREGQSARVTLGGAEVGSLGRLSEDTAVGYKFRQPVFVAEISLSALLTAGEAPALYTPLPRFPSVVRDVSLVAERGVAYGEMRRRVLALGIEECRGVTLVDVYEGANMPEGKRSLTLRIEYRADERTLRDEEADAMHARVIAALESEFGAQLRG